MAEPLDGVNKKENSRSKLYKFGKTILDEDDAVSFVQRICLQEEEEYLKIKAGGGHTNRLYVDNARAASSSSKKVKAETKVCYGDICERFRSSAKLPELVVRAQTIYCSRIALAHYNAEHETEYKLVEPLVSARVHANTGVGFHCNFTATKLKKDNTLSYPKLFYAEFECRRSKVRKMQCCVIEASTALRKCYTLGSEVALSWYNRKHGTHYEFVKVPRIHYWLENPYFCRTHCHFIAKLESASASDVTWSLFFTDYARYNTAKPRYAVVHCSILATGENVDALTQTQMPSNDRCRFCAVDFLHPPGYAPQYLNVPKLMSKVPPIRKY